MCVWILALQMEDKLAFPETSRTSLAINLWTFRGHRHKTTVAEEPFSMRVRRSPALTS